MRANSFIVEFFDFGLWGRGLWRRIWFLSLGCDVWLCPKGVAF